MYTLKGDGPIALVAYEQISCLHLHVSLEHYPNVDAVARLLANGNCTHERQLIAYAKAACVPAYAYFKEKFNNNLRPKMALFLPSNQHVTFLPQSEST